MCSGSKPSTITMPDTGAYSKQADMQIALMQQQQQGEMLLKQMQLSQSQESLRQVLSEARDFRTERANDTEANAQRMALLLGAPPPEKGAKAPVVGSDRESMTKPKGKRALRIDRQAAAPTQASGAGLNITTAG